MKKVLLTLLSVAFTLVALTTLLENSVTAGWTSMSSGATVNLSAVWGSAGNDVFAVTDAGEILHYNGTQWISTNTVAGALSGIWGTSGTDIFAAGGSGGAGAMLHYDGISWSPMTTGATNWFLAVSGFAGNDVFATGYNGDIYHYNGTNWTSMSSGATVNLSAVWGSAGNDVFAVGHNGTVLHYDGTGWTPMNSGSPMEHFHGIWGDLPTDVYLVGTSGTILHYDGMGWSPLNSGTTEYLYAVWGSAGNDIFAVGYNGTILHYDGTGWTPMNSGTTEHLYGVWGSSGSDVFAVGKNGTILHYDGIPSITTTTANPTTTTTVGVTTTVFPSAYTIDGMVEGAVRANVLIELVNGASQQTYTDDNGHYEFHNIAAGGHYFIVPQRKGYKFEPPEHEIHNLMNDEFDMNFISSKSRICAAELIYGEHSAEAELLRVIRDTVLRRTPEGQEIIKLYYQWSPILVNAIKNDEEFKEEIKELTDGILQLIGEK